MIFSGNVTMPSGAVLGYHVVDSIEILPDAAVVNVRVLSWASAIARDERYAPEVRKFSVPFANLTGFDLVIDEIKVELLGPEGALSGAQEVVEGMLISQAVSAKNREINAAREAANLSSFTFQDKQIACDRLSRSDIDGVVAEVSLTGSLPANFPGAWKAMDNTYVLIPDVATFSSMVQAMVQKGIANFMWAQQLKAYIYAPGRTLEEVAQVSWTMTLPE